MRFVNIVRLKLRSLFSRISVEQELDEELRYHLEREIEAGIAAGMTPEDARYAALQSVRDIEQRKEECRDMRGTRWMEDLGNDLRYGIRQLLKNKGFFAIAAVTLALGIGANTAIFSAVNGVLLRPFPYRHPGKLMSLWCSEPSNGIPMMGCSLPDLRAIAARNHSFEAVANYYTGDVNITGGTPERVQGIYASANLFPLLGVNPALGRTFAGSEEIFGKNHVVVLSDALWRERFAGRTDAIGETLHLNGEAYNVIGVMPPDFQFPDRFVRLWIPMSFAPNDDMATRDNHFISSIARLRPGISVTQARTDVQGIGRQLAHEFAENAGVRADGSDYLSSVVGNVRPILLILLGAVGMVLLIACVNVANLLLSRASRQLRELSVKAALGASRGRLIRQLLSESALLAIGGGCLGVAIGAWLVRLLRTFGPQEIPRLHGIEIETPVLVFAAAITLASVVLCGLAPAMGLTRIQVSDALKEGGRSLTAGSRTSRLRDVLVVAEVTLSLVLVIGAGLLLQTLWRLQHMNPGFIAKNVLAMSVALPQSKYPESEPFKTVQFFDELTKRLERIPGVKSVGSSTTMPIADWGGWGKYFTLEEHPASRLADVPVIQYRQVTPHFAEALQVPMIEGRFFTRDDGADRPLVAVINESARRRFFPNEDPIGKRVSPNPPESIIAKMPPSSSYRFPRLTIVGVIGDIRQLGLSRPTEPELFVPYAQGTVKDNQTPSNMLFLFIKADSAPLRLVSAVRRTVRSLDPEQPVADVATMEQLWRASLASQRFELALFGAFAMLALTLAAVGIYGVLSYSVRLRTNEIGIRMALGADAPDILKMVVRRGLGLGLVGIVIGAALALGLMRLMTSLLFGVQADDAGPFVGAALILMAVVAVASFVPSWRAARTDPLAVLRAE
ncbi:MAG TPA: ABC transporter permease [Bryobacteraceae bacterium]|nr:ABC transporter permease [Bryobacteraceae bacterium]